MASLPAYSVFIQEQLKGIQGRSSLLTQQEFEFLLRGHLQFSVGWFYNIDKNNYSRAWNQGNPGTFLSYTYIYPDADLAFVLLCNAQTVAAEKGLDALLEHLQNVYLNKKPQEK
jgi:hypothetical protein